MSSNYPYGFPTGLEVKGIPILTLGGKNIFVKPFTGSDNNIGTRWDKPVKTLTKALSIATANNNDVVYLISESNTAAFTTDYQSSSLAWNKDLTHLIGVGAPLAVSHRARIANTASSNINNVVTFSANGCIISNVQILNGDNNASALYAAKITGDRNYFENVHFAGIVGGTTQSAANAGDVFMDGADENIFRHCTFGVDTIERDTDPAGNIYFDSACTRNLFEDCLFQQYISNAGCPAITVADGTGIDRWTIFKNCLFMAKSTNKAVTQTEVFTLPVISQGAIVLQNTYAFSDGGAVDWDSNNRGIIWTNNVAAAATAAGGIMSNQ